MNRGLFFLLFIVVCSTTLWGSNSLIDTKVSRGNLKLVFKKKIRAKDIRHFTISANGFTKHVYDIKNAYLPKGKTHKYKAFRIGQYRPNILRIVIESTKKTQKKHRISRRTLYIPISKKHFYTKKRKKKKSGNGFKVVVDAGHGGIDNGASCCSLHEKQLTLSMAYNLKRRLEKKGYEVYMTRDSDKYISLIERTEFANKKQADIFVSIHINAAPKKKIEKLNGIEIYYLSLDNVHIKGKSISYKGNKVYFKDSFALMTDKKKIYLSRKLGIKVQKGMNKNIKKGYKSLISKLKESDFWVLTGTKMPTILVETGYITHKKDKKRLTSLYYRNLAIKGIVEGIDSYFGL